MNQYDFKKKEIEKIINLINVKKYEEVITKARILVKKFPHEYIFYNALGMALMNMNKYDESLEVLNKAIRLDENNIHVLNNLGLAHGYLANYQKAINSYIEAHKIHPNMKSPLSMIEKLQIQIKKESI